MNDFKNDNPFAPWNNPMHADNPFMPHNNPMRRDNPFEPWNNPFGSERDLSNEDRRKYGLRNSRFEDED